MVLRRPVSVLALVLAAVGAEASGPVARLASPDAASPDAARGPTHDCNEFVPAAVSVPGVNDDGRPVTLDVLVLLDGVGEETGRRVAARTADAFAPLAIGLRAMFLPVTFAGEDELALIAEASALYGGARPPGIDVVQVLTAKSMPFRGMADCIGGVRYPDRGFSVQEDFEWLQGTDCAGVPDALTCWVDYAAVAFAHEIGHELGAQHHYSSCVEGLEPGALLERGQARACTIMQGWPVPTLPVPSLRFSRLEGAVIRGHALAFAAP